ncbi:MAG: tyrosine-type recombinase/integrase [Pseudonocardia sp.]|nr:tyrosine-type recombinase/integrase [Pseudonocardia sp.]
MDDVSPGTLAPTNTGPTTREPAGATRPVAVAGELLARLDVEHAALSGLPTRERLLAATRLGSYRSARTRRAYAGHLAAWLGWLCEIDLDALHVLQVHVNLYVRQLLDTGAAASSTSRRLSALSSSYRHLVEHDLIAANPAAAVRRPTVDPDHTVAVGMDRDQARAFIAAADADLGPALLRTAAAARLLLHLGLRVDEFAAADLADLGHDRGHRVLTVTRKGGRRATVVLPAATATALDLYLADRASSVGAGGRPLLATATGGRLDQGALWKLVRRLARAPGIPSREQLSPPHPAPHPHNPRRRPRRRRIRSRQKLRIPGRNPR